jgi:hypothetical protein
MSRITKPLVAKIPNTSIKIKMSLGNNDSASYEIINMKTKTSSQMDGRYDRNMAYHYLQLDNQDVVYLFLFYALDDERRTVEPVAYVPKTSSVMHLGKFSKFQVLNGGYIIQQRAAGESYYEMEKIDLVRKTSKTFYYSEKSTNENPFELVKLGLNSQDNLLLTFQRVMEGCFDMTLWEDEVIGLKVEDDDTIKRKSYFLPKRWDNK